LQYGYYFENCRAIRMNRVMADNCGGFGFDFNGCNWVYGDEVYASQGGDIGFVYANGTSNVMISHHYASGRAGLPGDNSSPLYWTDDTVSNVNMNGGGISEGYSGALYGGFAQSKINFVNPVF